MKFSWKTIIAAVCYLLGVLGWIYVGGFLVITKPVKGIILAQIGGHLSIAKVLLAVLQGFFYLSLAGGIWCVGYILSYHFKEK